MIHVKWMPNPWDHPDLVNLAAQIIAQDYLSDAYFNGLLVEPYDDNESPYPQQHEQRTQPHE